MNPTDLLRRLRDCGVEVWVEGGQLAVSDEQALSDGLRRELTDRAAEVVRFLTDLVSGEEARAAHGIPPAPRGDELPLSFAQQRLWFMSRFSGAGAALNLILPCRLRGELDVPALDWSLGEIVRRHRILRTSFPQVADRPVQRVRELDGCALEIVDLANHAHPEREALAHVDAELHREIDPRRGRLVRFTLLRVAPRDHVLTVLTHHIVADRASHALLCKELGALYGARVSGRRPVLPELSLQFADYAAWQRRTYDGRAQRLLGYWKRQLRDLPTLALPTDRPRPATPMHRGATGSLSVRGALAAALDRLARGERATLFMTMLAAFKVLLARYAGQAEVVVGTPVSARDAAGTESLVGPLFNLLVLRSSVPAELGFRALLAHVRQVTLEALAHRDMPFEQLIVESRAERDPGRNPLFQVMFNFLDDAPAPALPGVECDLLEPGAQTTALDLSLVVDARPDGLTVVVHYDVELFDHATIERMLGHYRNLLEGIADDPDRRVGDLSLLTAAERRILLTEWAHRRREDPAADADDRCVHELFEAQVERAPDAIAVMFEGQSLSFGALNAGANQLAHHLRARGAAPERPIAICVQRSPDLLVGLLGILKSGAAYVPLDPNQPKKRIAVLLEQARVDLLVTQEALRHDLPPDLPRLVLLDAHAEAIAAASSRDPTRVCNAENLAYVMLTSGSTGRPKGVLIEHRGLVRALGAMAREPGLSAGDVAVATTTITFDIAALELFLPLLVGGKVVIAAAGTSTDGARLADLMGEVESTSARDGHRGSMVVAQATPTTWRLLVAAGWRGGSRYRLLCGGEVMPPDLLEQMLPRCGELWSMYGLTETGVWSTAHRVAAPCQRIPVGAPIEGMELYLLDPRGHPVPIGVIGEIYIGGVGLARGYAHRADLTGERFVPHPFSGRRGARLHRSGDLARYRADGALELHGRADHQVKVRGVRIELGEVELELQRHEAVAECAVVAETRGGDRQLVAYVVFKPAKAPTASEFRELLRDRLPDHMVPRTYISLDDLPVTPSGKVDRGALASIGGGSVAMSHATQPPSTPTERAIAAAWSDALGVDPIGIHDNFFDLGGHSLLAVQVATRLEESFGCPVSPAALLLHTLCQLAEMIDGRPAAEP